ncbi:MAG: phage integrase N-terminal SAM-like domain-containing protein [Rhodoplanes sp.]
MSDTTTVSPLRQRMIEDMAARKLNPHTQRHISSCKRFAVWLKRSPDTATPDEVRRFQLHLIESGASICNRNRDHDRGTIPVPRHAASPRSGG